MPRPNILRNAILVILLSILIFGVIQLFLLRFQAGDMYPAYSSLRSDPLGTRAFYESLGKFRRINRQRNYQMLDTLKPNANVALLYLGAEIPKNDSIPRKISQTLDSLTAAGGRLVVTYLPIYRKNSDTSGSKDHAAGSDSPKSTAKEGTGKAEPAEPDHPDTRPKTESDNSEKSSVDSEASDSEFVLIREHWGFDFAYADIPESGEAPEKRLALKASGGLPDLPTALSWHTNLYFELLDDNWRTVYAVDGKPVVIERPMGQGTIVLCSDSFFISNEAMRTERHPQLLVWLLGGKATVIFDESHFGLYRVPGVAGLLRRYQFHWFFGALAVVALLFVWKNSLHFIPPPAEEPVPDAENVSGKDYTQGLVALLRRHIKRNEILQVCGREWERTFKNDQHIGSGAIEQMNRILKTEKTDTRRKPNPVPGYQKISRLFQRMRVYTIKG